MTEYQNEKLDRLTEYRNRDPDRLEKLKGHINKAHEVINNIYINSSSEDGAILSECINQIIILYDEEREERKEIIEIFLTLQEERLEDTEHLTEIILFLEKQTDRKLTSLQRQVLQEASMRQQAERTLQMILTQMMEHSTGQHIEISGGTVHGHVGQTSGGIYTQNDLASISSLINTISTHYTELALPTEQLAELESSLQKLQAQLDAPKPNPTILREGLRSVRTILEGATGGAIANDAPTWIPLLVDLINRLG